MLPRPLKPALANGLVVLLFLQYDPEGWAPQIWGRAWFSARPRHGYSDSNDSCLRGPPRAPLYPPPKGTVLCLEAGRKCVEAGRKSPKASEETSSLPEASRKRPETSMNIPCKTGPSVKR